MLQFLLWLITFCAFSEGLFKTQRFSPHKVFSNFEVHSTHSIYAAECCFRCMTLMDCFGVTYKDKECKLLSGVSALVGYESTEDTTEVLLNEDLLEGYKTSSKIPYQKLKFTYTCDTFFRHNFDFWWHIGQDHNFDELRKF